MRGRHLGVEIRDGETTLYTHAAKRRRIPASNQKLLLSMALLARVSSDARLITGLAGPAPIDGVVTGDVWVYGRGDPTLTGSIEYARSLPLRETRLGWLVAELRRAGVSRITGRMIGSTGYFLRDWFAPGWERDFPSRYIPIPTALSINGNVEEGRHFPDPEMRTARALTRKLRRAGIAVGGKPGAGAMPRGLGELATVRSAPLSRLVQYMNHKSSNFFAEMFGKLLAVERSGPPGSIAGGAAAIEAWARKHGVGISALDSSGLSYDNRVSPRGLVKLLGIAESRPWGPVLMLGLPGGGEGTLEDRLREVELLAKTGTLEGISTLSGWVWLERRGVWAEFSIMSRGMSKARASEIEDRIVRLVHHRAD